MATILDNNRAALVLAASFLFGATALADDYVNEPPGVFVTTAPHSGPWVGREVWNRCAARLDLVALFPGRQEVELIVLKSTGPENEDYLAVQANRGFFSFRHHFPDYPIRPTLFLLDKSTCEIAHVFRLLPRADAGEYDSVRSDHYLVFNKPANQIVIFSKWVSSASHELGKRKTRGAYAASYDYQSFALQRVRRWADPSHLPQEDRTSQPASDRVPDTTGTTVYDNERGAAGAIDEQALLELIEQAEIIPFRKPGSGGTPPTEE